MIYVCMSITASRSLAHARSLPKRRYKVHPLRITDVKNSRLCTSVLLAVKGNSNNLLQSF